MITDFWGQPTTEKKVCGLAAFRKAERARRYHASPKGKATRKKHKSRWITLNPEKHKQNKQAWATAHPENVKNSNFNSRYRITIAEKHAKFEAQGYKCAICGTSDFGKKAAHTDHCHKTNVFRGVLCFGCNRGLGSFGDNIEHLEAAIKYLQYHRRNHD